MAQVEIARHPAIALDLLAFQAASKMLGKRPVADGPDVEFNLPQAAARSVKQRSPTVPWRRSGRHCRPAGSKPQSEADRFEAFRSLPEAAKLELLAYCVALTLQPKLGPAEGDEATAYDAALSLTGASVAGYWRPAKDNFLSRVTREQLLAIGREVLGEAWAQSHSNDKKVVAGRSARPGLLQSGEVRPDAGAGREAEKLASAGHGV